MKTTVRGYTLYTTFSVEGRQDVQPIQANTRIYSPIVTEYTPPEGDPVVMSDGFIVMSDGKTVVSAGA